MFGRSDYAITVGRIAGAPVKIGPGALILAAYFAIQLGASWADRVAPGLAWSVAALTGLGFMASILVHESAHALVARRRGVGVDEIRLWLLGGSAAMSRRTPDPASEMLISVAGPLSTLALGAGFFGLGRTVSGSLVVPYLDPVSGVTAGAIAAEALFWLGTINLVLGFFNLLPALPLDGGRVLTGALWKLRGDRLQATRWVSSVSKVMAYLAFGFAAVELFVWNSGLPIWTIFIAMMFLRGGDAELASLSLSRQLDHVSVADVARPAPPSIHLDTNTASARALLPHPSTARYAIAIDDDRVVRGLIDLRALWVAADHDGTNPVADIMEPVDEHRAAFASEPLSSLIDRGVAPPFVVIDHGWRPTGLVESMQQLTSARPAPTPTV
ncbi:MAG: site-2 protease family protein [Acidimicrobiales bacterium]